MGRDGSNAGEMGGRRCGMVVAHSRQFPISLVNSKSYDVSRQNANSIVVADVTNYFAIPVRPLIVKNSIVTHLQ